MAEVPNYMQSNYPMAQLYRNNHMVAVSRSQDGNLNPLTREQLEVAYSQFSLLAKVEHFFGWGSMGYLSLEKEFRMIRRENAKSEIRIHAAIDPRQNYTMQDYFDRIIQRNLICKTVSMTYGSVWGRITTTQWNQHSSVSKVVIMVQQIFLSISRELKSQGRLMLHWSDWCCIQSCWPFNNDDPYDANFDLRTIKQTTNTLNEQFVYTMKHTVQASWDSIFVFSDNKGNRREFPVESFRLPQGYLSLPDGRFKNFIRDTTSTLGSVELEIHHSPAGPLG